MAEGSHCFEGGGYCVTFFFIICVNFSMLTLKSHIDTEGGFAGWLKGSLARPAVSVKWGETSKKQIGESQAFIIKIYSYTNLQLLNSKKKGLLWPRKRT